MGTRADFYVGIGRDAEWLGSIAFDGFTGDVFDGSTDTLSPTPDDESAWRCDIARYLAGRDDSTLPDRGWPWPWDDSGTTDYAYAYDPVTDRVLGSGFGGPWFLVVEGEPEDDEGYPDHSIDRDGIGLPDFPDMSARKNVRTDKGSGAIFLSFGGES